MSTEFNKIMSEYFDISYSDAIKFLQKLYSDEANKEMFEELAQLYHVVFYDNDEFIEDLAAVITDEDLEDLGYFQQSKFDDISEGMDAVELYHDFNNVDEIEDFLETLDSMTLDELKTQFDTNLLSDIAIAITEKQLKDLGYSAKNKEEAISDGFDNELIFGNCYSEDYDEDLDFLEDLPSDIYYTIIDKPEFIFCCKDGLDYENFKCALDPNLVETCEKLEVQPNDGNVYFKVVPKKYEDKAQINEEVIINSELNPNIFDENHVMKDETKVKILEYVDEFIDEMKKKDIDIPFTDITLIGSNAGYLYTPESDIDVHLIMSKPLSVEEFNELRTEMLNYTTEKPLLIGNNAIELNLEDGANMEANSNRRYSIIDDIWVDDSDKNEVYTEEDLNKIEGYEDVLQEYMDKIDKVIEDDDYNNAVLLKAEIRQNRSEDLANVGALSLGNVVFKELRSNGYFGKLREYVKSKEIDIDEKWDNLSIYKKRRDC